MDLFDLLKTKTHIIWDWNGTILDDVNLCVDVLDMILKKYGLPLVSKEFYLSHCSFPMFKFYEQLGFDLNKYNFSSIADDFMKFYFENLYYKSKIYDDVLVSLNILKANKINMYILSAACESSLKEQVNTFNLRDYFQLIYGVENHLAHGKIERGKDLLNHLSDISKSKILLIGDTDHDFYVAKELGIDMILTADGHQSLDRLSSLGHEVPVLRNKVELRQVITGVFNRH